jgi:tRNA dimethylallyltransferase
LVQRVDPVSGDRILPRDRKRLVRALEVYFLTGRPLSAHFAETVSPTDFCEVVPIGLRIPAALTSFRVARRVDAQFERGLMDEIHALLASGVPESARPFGGLVYRQGMELLRGVRAEAATRALIVQENRRYARRQLIWFRKEPNLVWLDGPGEVSDVIERAARALTALLEPHG